MKIGLALGGGGILGGAWIAGGLHALRLETGWEPSLATHVLGTSAGAFVGALVSVGLPTSALLPGAAAEVLQVLGLDGDPGGLLELTAESLYGRRRVPLPLPGSWRLFLHALRGRCPSARIGLVCGIAPRGFVSNLGIEDTVRLVAPSGWPDRPQLWVTACDYRTGSRVAFGGPGAPAAKLARAVTASCAIPAFYRPVRIAGRDYVDGGLWSGSNLDLLAGQGLDLVICLNPMSSRGEVASRRNPLLRLAAAARRAAALRLRREASLLEAQGTRVLLLEPTGQDLLAFGRNLMDAGRRAEIHNLAVETVGKQLRALGTEGLLKRADPEPHRPSATLPGEAVQGGIGASAPLGGRRASRPALG